MNYYIKKKKNNFKYLIFFFSSGAKLHIDFDKDEKFLMMNNIEKE
jgi:hypothetical protein